MVIKIPKTLEKDLKNSLELSCSRFSKEERKDLTKNERKIIELLEKIANK